MSPFLCFEYLVFEHLILDLLTGEDDHRHAATGIDGASHKVEVVIKFGVFFVLEASVDGFMGIHAINGSTIRVVVLLDGFWGP